MKILSLVLLGIFAALPGWASEKSFEGRIFAGGVSVKPAPVNDELTANDIKKISTTLMLGLEATGFVTSWANLGLRYIKNQVSRDEDPSDPQTSYKVFTSQDIFMGMARFPLVRSDFLHVDAFGGVGGAQTTFKLETANQIGELSKGPFSTLVTAYGASAAIGFRKVFLFVEGGFLNDKVDGFKRSGTLNNKIQTVDLSGPYALVGFIFADSANIGAKK